MSERKTVFLDGAPIWYPLLGSVPLLVGLEAIYSVGSLPFVLSIISWSAFVINLGMLLSCRSAFGRWLGRTKYPDMGLLLSSCVFIINGFIFMSSDGISDTTHTPAVFTIFSILICSMIMAILACVTSSIASYYIEDSEGHQVSEFELYVDGSPYDDNDVWTYCMQKKRIRSGDKLMCRTLFGSRLVRETQGLEWRAWHVDHIGDDKETIMVFGHDITSARQSAAQMLKVDPDFIVVAPKEMDKSCAAEFLETAKRVQTMKEVHQRAVMEENARQKQEKKAEVDALQNQVSSQISHPILENHATRMDRLFTQAIGTPYTAVVVDRN
jgi:hypothetical protein